MIIALCLALLVACTRTDESKGERIPGNACILLYDVTDEMWSVPDPVSVKSYLGLTDQSRGAFYKGVAVSDVEYNRADEAEITPKSFVMSNPLERRKAVQEFLAKVDASVNRLNQEEVGRSHSNIYRVIAREANRLQSGELGRYEHRSILVLSDLRENGIINFYEPGMQEKLLKHPEEVRRMLEDQATLANLDGVEVHLIYQARDYDDSVVYTAIAAIYRQIFEAAGAKLIISGNL